MIHFNDNIPLLGIKNSSCVKEKCEYSIGVQFAYERSLIYKTRIDYINIVNVGTKALTNVQCYFNNKLLCIVDIPYQNMHVINFRKGNVPGWDYDMPKSLYVSSNEIMGGDFFVDEIAFK